MTAEGTAVFLTDAGDEFSVRSVQHHTSTATTTLEPLYASDLELMDGVTGQLRVPSGATLRGTLRQRGNVFVLHPEQAPEGVLEQTDTTSTPTLAPQPAKRAKRKEKTAERAPVAPPPQVRIEPPKPTAEASKPTKQTAPSQTEAIKVPTTVAQVSRGDGGKVFEKIETRPPASSPVARRAKPKESVPEPAPVAPSPTPRAEPTEATRTATPSQAEAIEALKIVAQFVGSDFSQLLKRTATTSLIAFPGPAPSQVEAIEAARAVAQFLRDDPSVDLELAKQAQAIVNDFIAERERKARAGDN